jgi:gliding motility-associated-like protein
VANTISTVSVTPTTSDPNASVKVNGTTVPSGTASGAIPLAVGANAITVICTAQNGTTIKTYTVMVTRALSADATLAALTTNNGALSPAFKAGVTSYSVAVASTVTSIRLTPTVNEPNATVKVNGAVVLSGRASAVQPLAVGANTITTVVTAQDGITVKTYTITVTRAPVASANLSALVLSTGVLSPVFATNRLSYTASVATGVTSMSITPTAADPTAAITVNGTGVTSGSASAALPLTIGSNTITIVVTAAGSTLVKTYTITVTRALPANANIVKIKLSSGTLSPTFTQATISYAASVVNTVSSVTLTPTLSDVNATVKVNGTPVSSGTESGEIALNVGSNTITTIATAQDGKTTKTYTITVTRAMAGANSLYEPVSVINPENTPAIADNITVHGGISPNGDGINDFLVIDGINSYPDNKLSITTRNGELVYQASGYDNASRVFDGHSSKTGKMQQPGTYFYALDYKVGEVTKHKTGFIVLKW